MPKPTRSFELHSPFPADRRTPRGHVLPSECATYRFFDARGTLLYVGISWNPFTRWGHHRRHALWWDAATRVLVDVYESEAVALAHERQWIKSAEPPRFNVRSAQK